MVRLGPIISRVNKENIPSRAYIAFKTQVQVAVFGREYDGHKFVDKAGETNASFNLSNLIISQATNPMLWLSMLHIRRYLERRRN